MKKIVIAAALLAVTLFGTSCARTFEGINRDFQSDDRSYHVEVYSGGKLVKTYDFKGILNNSQQSDGYYFTQGDTLTEIGGDVIITSVD